MSGPKSQRWQEQRSNGPQDDGPPSKKPRFSPSRGPSGRDSRDNWGPFNSRGYRGPPPAQREKGGPPSSRDYRPPPHRPDHRSTGPRGRSPPNRRPVSPPSPSRRRHGGPPVYDAPPSSRPGSSRALRPLSPSPGPPKRGPPYRPRSISPPRPRSPGRPRSPPPRSRSPRRISPPPPYPDRSRDGGNPGRSERQGLPSYPLDDPAPRPAPMEDSLESRRRQLQLKEKELQERERLLKAMAEEPMPPLSPVLRPGPSRAEVRDPYLLDRPTSRRSIPADVPVAHQPPPYRRPDPREEPLSTSVRPLRSPAPLAPVVDVAKALEGQLEALLKRNDTVAMLEAYESSKLAGVQPTVQSHLCLLSALSLAEDAINMESIYNKLFLQPNLNLQPEQCYEAIFILSQSPLKSRVIELFMHLRRTGHLIQNPVTYRILMSCCTDGGGAMAIFEDMKKSDMLISVPTYHNLLTLVSGQPHSVRIILQDMVAHSVNPTDVLVQMKAPEALAMAQAIVQSGAPVEEPLFLQLLQKVGSTDIPGLLAMWRKSPSLMTVPCATGLMSLALQHGQLATALSIWEEVQKHRLAGDGPVAFMLIEALSAAKDTRAFAVYNEAKGRLQASLSLFNYILAVAAHHRIVHVAKEMWRDMQASDVLPDDEALYFILQAASRDQRASVELFDVIRASQLAIPSTAATLLFEAFNRTDEGRARIPDLRRACPELNTTHPVQASNNTPNSNPASMPARQSASRSVRPNTYNRP